MATILCLFTESEMKGECAAHASTRSVESSASALVESRAVPMLQEAVGLPDSTQVNPCVSCSMRDMCDNDNCGLHDFALDSPFPSTRFPNLGVYVNFIKHYGWL